MKDPYLSYLECRDRKSYTLFVTEYLDVITRFARRVAVRPEIADDAVQEAFLRLGDAKIRADNVASPRAYILRTVLNVARNILRNEGVRRVNEKEAGEEHAGVQRSVAEELIAKESVLQIYRAIDRLDDECRLAIHLRAIENLSYAEIAQVTAASEGTVATRIRRARRELKRLLGSTVATMAWTNLKGSRRAGLIPTADPELHTRIATLFFAHLDRPGNTLFETLRQSPHVGFPGARELLLVAVSAIALTGLKTSSHDWTKEAATASRDRLAGIPDRASTTNSTQKTVSPTTPKGGQTMTSSQQLSAALAVTIGLAVTPWVQGDPGDLVAVIPSAAIGPHDLTYDTDTDSYWVTSVMEYVIYQYSSDLTEVLGTIPLPFENPVYSSSHGIAFNSVDGTLLVVDSRGDAIWEIERDGTPTGIVLRPGYPDMDGLAFNPIGEGGEGSIFVVLRKSAIVNELSLDGRI